MALICDKDEPWESKFSPKITVRAKYEPYDALRQRFWRQYCTQYDADETGSISYTEVTTMLDSLGSTLTNRTLEGYFIEHGKNPETDELTIEEVVTSLEREVFKGQSEKAKISKKDQHGLMTESPTPPMAPHPAKHGLDMTGPQGNISSPVDADELREHIIASQPRDRPDSELDPRAGNLRRLSEPDDGIPAVKVDRTASLHSQDPPMLGHYPDSESSSAVITATSSEAEGEAEDGEMDGLGTPGEGSGSGSSPNDIERIINIRTCPLCHRRRLGKRSEQDIVTHLAICASADWSRVDRIVTANYVTSSQAQRKFFTKLINKVAIGSYTLGANSANIFVQDRMTGQLQEEKMAVSSSHSNPRQSKLTYRQVYVRIGIRVLYKGARSRMEGTRGEWRVSQARDQC